MKKFIWLFLGISFSLFSCKKEKDGPTVKVENEVNSFIYGAMNSWYYWQNDVNTLKDGFFTDQDQLNTFLNSYTSPEALFEDFKHPDDDFSWIVDDYEALENSFQGIRESFGYDFGLRYVNESSNTIFGYIQYVLPGSPAEEAGLKRGNIFTKVNGTVLTDQNFGELLFSSVSYSITLAEMDENGNLLTSETVVPLSARLLTEPAVLLAKTIPFEGKKIGYLVYNQFVHTQHDELNTAIGKLLVEGAEEMILDLRYNGGGSVFTAMHLASMMNNTVTENQIFARLLFNNKKSDENVDLPFVTTTTLVDEDFRTLGTRPMNRLNLDRLYVLVTGNTASASELVIAGLQPYMSIKLIGTQTVGKNEGSITLYDSPKSDYQEDNNINPRHKWAIQPIVSRLANSDNFSDYSDGFIPDIIAPEHQNIREIRELGDPEDYMLKIALQDIVGLQPARLSENNNVTLEIRHKKKAITGATDALLNGLY